MHTNRENLILGLPRRPRGEYRNTGTAIGALVGLILTENAGGAILGDIASKCLDKSADAFGVGGSQLFSSKQFVAYFLLSCAEIY